MPTRKIFNAPLGAVQVNGAAAGPHTMPAPISGNLCFLYRTTVWQKTEDTKKWRRIADETLHVPFFVDDSTGQLLIEPLGADLDLRRDLREEYSASFFVRNGNEIPPRVAAFLSRHGISRNSDLRIEERSIKPGDALFAAGTLTENPGVKMRPFSLRGGERGNRPGGDNPIRPAPENLLEPAPAQQVIRLSAAETASSAQEMSQQARIAAALTRAGITKPEAWLAAGVSCPAAAAAQNTPLAIVPPRAAGRPSGLPVQEVRVHEDGESEDQTELSSVAPAPPAVLMKNASDPTFVISSRSQKEFIRGLARKSAAMAWGGAGLMLFGMYMLLALLERL